MIRQISDLSALLSAKIENLKILRESEIILEANWFSRVISPSHANYNGERIKIFKAD